MGCDLLALLDGHKPCLLFEQLFLEQMPDDIRLIIAENDFTDPRQLAARADVLWQVKQQGKANINNTNILRISQTSAQGEGSSRSLSISATDKYKLCYFHRWSCSEARQCRLRCTHPGNALVGRP